MYEKLFANDHQWTQEQMGVFQIIIPLHSVLVWLESGQSRCDS